MARPRSTTKVVCQNEKCSFFHKKDDKDIIKKGINSAGHRQYLCLHCKTYFVETKDTPLFNRKLSEREIKRICIELVEKKGIRAVERTTGHHRDTISKLLDDLAAHATKATNYLVHNLDLSEYEVDELWTFVKKTKRRLNLTTKSGLSRVSNGHTLV